MPFKANIMLSHFQQSVEFRNGVFSFMDDTIACRFYKHIKAGWLLALLKKETLLLNDNQAR